MAHFGVFVQDLSNVINIVLRLLFYITRYFYNVETRLAKFAPWNKVILHCNPLALLLTSARRCMIYDQTPARKIPASVDGAEFHTVSDRSKDYL